jgi:hypothetical protein
MLIIQAKSLQDDVTAFYEGAKELVQNYYDEATAAGDAFASLKSTTTDEGSLASQVASLKAQVEHDLGDMVQQMMNHNDPDVV